MGVMILREKGGGNIGVSAHIFRYNPKNQTQTQKKKKITTKTPKLRKKGSIMYLQSPQPPSILYFQPDTVMPDSPPQGPTMFVSLALACSRVKVS